MRIQGTFEPTKAFMGDPWLSWCFLMPMMPQLESKSDRYIKSDAHHHTQPNTAELRRVSFLVLRFPCEFSCLFLTQDFSTQNNTKFYKGNEIFNINQNTYKDFQTLQIIRISKSEGFFAHTAADFYHKMDSRIKNRAALVELFSWKSSTDVRNSKTVQKFAWAGLAGSNFTPILFFLSLLQTTHT